MEINRKYKPEQMTLHVLQMSNMITLKRVEKQRSNRSNWRTVS